MSRGVGVTRDVAAALEPVEPLLAVLTQLGDVWFLLVLALGLYWLPDRVPLADWDRRQGLRVVAVALLAFSVTHVLKGALAFPRPPGAETALFSLPGPLGPLYGNAATATGYGFPSGHAIGSAAVYGTIALSKRDNWHDPRIWTAGAVIALVSLTRVGLGVHYVVDVVVGAAVGLAIAGLAVRLDVRPVHLLGVAALVAGGRLLVAPFVAQTAALLGASVGAVAGIVATDASRQPAAPAPPRELLAVWIGGGACMLAGPPLFWLDALLASVGVTTLGVGLLAIALPATPWVGEKRR